MSHIPSLLLCTTSLQACNHDPLPLLFVAVLVVFSVDVSRDSEKLSHFLSVAQLLFSQQILVQ